MSLETIAGINFDWTVTFGNMISTVAFLFLAIIAWRDLTWRISNLEIWRKEHMIDADSRDLIIKRMDELLVELRTILRGRRKE